MQSSLRIFANGDHEVRSVGLVRSTLKHHNLSILCWSAFETLMLDLLWYEQCAGFTPHAGSQIEEALLDGNPSAASAMYWKRLGSADTASYLSSSCSGMVSFKSLYSATHRCYYCQRATIRLTNALSRFHVRKRAKLMDEDEMDEDETDEDETDEDETGEDETDEDGHSGAEDEASRNQDKRKRKQDEKSVGKEHKLRKRLHQYQRKVKVLTQKMKYWKKKYKKEVEINLETSKDLLNVVKIADEELRKRDSWSPDMTRFMGNECVSDIHKTFEKLKLMITKQIDSVEDNAKHEKHINEHKQENTDEYTDDTKDETQQSRIREQNKDEDIFDKFLAMQQDIKVQKATKRTIHWPALILNIAIAIYQRSRQCYTQLKSFGVLQLPSERLMRMYMAGGLFSSEVDLFEMRRQVGEMKEFAQRINHKFKGTPHIMKGYLTVDEMSIRSNCCVSKATGEWCGFAEDFDTISKLLDVYNLQTGAPRVAATHITACLWSSFILPFQILVSARSTTKDIDGTEVQSMMCEAFMAVNCVGLTSPLLICDAASSNKNAIRNHMCEGCGPTGMKLWHMFDPTHIYKRF